MPQQHGTQARRCRSVLFAVGVAACAATYGLPADQGGDPTLDPAGLMRALARVHPDYRRYVSGVRPLDPGINRRLYMALVRPGAGDPADHDSAPYAGPGARNDIVYDREAILAGHSLAFRYLLLDHEYFHARHLAGGTLLPLASGAGADIERHYNEAAAWGYNVAEARAGRYPGLRPDEFREALDRQGEHYAALKGLLKEKDPATWGRIAELLRDPGLLITNDGSPLSGDRWRLFGSDRSPAIPSGSALPCRVGGPGDRPARGR